MNCRSDAERAARATYMRDYYRTHPEHAAKRRARAKKYYREKINDPAWRERERQRWRSRHAPRVEHHSERRAARIAVSNALRDGELMKPNACVGCGGAGKLNAHHSDYSK